MPKQDCVYMLRCENGSLYTGWTNHIGRRLAAHRSGKGAKYTRGFHAARLVYLELMPDKSAALHREAALKKAAKAEKEALAAQWLAENGVTLSLGTAADAPEIAAIYRWYVANSTATFQTSLPTDEEYIGWVEEACQAAPLLVARSTKGKLLGYACAHQWRPREAFRWDVETTVYCAPDCTGQGVGQTLMECLLEILKMQGYWNAYALITDPNPESEALHKRLGYRCQGRSPRTAYKLEQWVGLATWGLSLHEGEAAPTEPNRCPDPAAVAEILTRHQP